MKSAIFASLNNWQQQLMKSNTFFGLTYLIKCKIISSSFVYHNNIIQINKFFIRRQQQQQEQPQHQSELRKMSASIYIEMKRMKWHERVRKYWTLLLRPNSKVKGGVGQTVCWTHQAISNNYIIIVISRVLYRNWRFRYTWALYVIARSQTKLMALSLNCVWKKLEHHNLLIEKISWEWCCLVSGKFTVKLITIGSSSGKLKSLETIHCHDNSFKV